jgi:predicted nuclease of predicted toxin-antitoxin system
MTAFLADENFPGSSIELLRQAGHDVISVAEIAPSALDSDILNHAVSERRIVITLDKDFGELVFNQNMDIGSGIIYLRLGNFLPEEPAKLIIESLQESASRFDGVFSVISRDSIRQRRR